MHVPAHPLIPRVTDFIAAQMPRAWLVGGYVRDRLLGRPNHDLDVIVPEGGIVLARSIARAFGGAFFVLDGERDVGRAILRGAADQPLEVDVARLRSPLLLDDLALRDFTVNAIALEIGQDVAGSSVFDPFDGQQDLACGLLRAVTEGAFIDDPLRTLRGVRQSVELGFRIDSATLNLIRRDAPMLARVAAERVREELYRIVAVPGAWQHGRLLADLDLLRPVLPEADAQIGMAQSPPHYQDVFDHSRSAMAHLEGLYALMWPDLGYARPAAVADDDTVIAVEAYWTAIEPVLAPFAGQLRAHLVQPLAAGRPRRETLFWATLAHDWGKPATQQVDEHGKIRYLNHDQVGAELATARTRALRFATSEVAYISALVRQHMRPTFLAKVYPPSRRAIYRFFRDAGDAGPDGVLLSLADEIAVRAGAPDPARIEARMGTTRMLLEAFFQAHSAQVDPTSLLDGRQIMAEFGLSAGPQIGRLLAGLREAQATGEVREVDQARAWVAEQLARGREDA